MDTQQQKCSDESQKRVLVIGDSCQDVYHYGTCDRLSPEAPVPVLRVTKTEVRPGMCINVAYNLMGLGVYVDYITQCTPIEKHRYVEEKRLVHLLRVDDEPNNVDEVQVPTVIAKLKTHKYAAVVISDYDKGFIKMESGMQIVNAAKGYSIPIFVDTKKHNMGCYNDCIIKINKREFDGVKVLPHGDYELIITIGEGGAEWRGKLYPTKKVQLYDVCGAGDAFLAGLVFKYLQTGVLDSAIKFANKCASKSVTHFGNYVLGNNDAT